MAQNVTATHDYLQDLPPRHHKIFDVKELQKAQSKLFGPNWDSQNYDKRFDNIRTAKLQGGPHHCTHQDQKGHAQVRFCVEDGHVGYCIEFMNALVNQFDYRVRCGARYKMESGGCGAHPHKKMANSKNLLIKNMYAGKLDEITWGDLYDTEMDQQNPVALAGPTAKQIAQQRVERLAKHDEERDTVYDLPANPLVYQPHLVFEEAKKNERNTQAAERKQAKAEKRNDGGLLGRVAQKV